MKVLTQRVAVPRWLLVVFVLLAGVTTGQTAWYNWEQQKCNEGFSQNLAQRSKWSDLEREAQKETRQAQNAFWIQVFEHPQDREANLEAFEHWVRTFQDNEQLFERIDKLRAETPLPDLADCD